eukprot:2731170-Pyramimonas_sp.AAC.1
MQGQKPLWPAWGVCGHQPVPISGEGRFESAMTYHSGQAGFEGPGYEEEGENWLASPPPVGKNMMAFDDTEGIMDPAMYPFSSAMRPKENSLAKVRFNGYQNDRVLGRAFEKEGQVLGGPKSSVEFKCGRLESYDQTPKPNQPLRYQEVPKVSTSNRPGGKQLRVEVPHSADRRERNNLGEWVCTPDKAVNTGRGYHPMKYEHTGFSWAASNSHK